jgi:hypothetical protein
MLFLVGRLHHEFAERHGFYRGVTPNWDEGVCLGKDFLKNIIYRGQSVQKFLDQVRFGDGEGRIELAEIVINFFKLFRIFIDVLLVCQPYIIELAAELVRYFCSGGSVVGL